jgi:hypothetical protein
MRSKVMWGTIILLSSTTFAACQASQPVDAAANQPEPILELPQQPPAPQSAPASVKVKAAQPKQAVAARGEKPAASKVTAVTTSATTREATPVMTDAPALASSPAAATAQDEDSIATTIAGCLVHDDNVFQLKDTDGIHAPKSRSWKSGFIKRSSTKVDLLGGTDRLASHVGYRISVSGTLTDREMQVRTVRATTERCD